MKQSKTFRNILVYVLVCSLMLGLSPNTRSYAAEHDNVRMKDSNWMVNDYIGLYADSSGRFSIGTTEGNPELSTDNYKKILYGYSGTSTSYTTICINGSPYCFTGNNAVFSTDTASECCEQTIDGVHVSQVLSFRRNSATGREDVVEIAYVATNTSDVDKKVGCRIMMDTQLGDNDNAPFRVPGYGAITTETEFVGEEIPQIWQAFDSLSNPGVIAQGRFYKSESDRPDKVQFANWRRLHSVSWELQLNKDSDNGDSGVAATWYEETLAPGESREYKTYYGLSELTQDLTGPLLLSVYSESELEVIDNAYAPNPFPVNAYIENVGSKAVENARIRIELPEGLVLAEDSEHTIDIGSMEKNQLNQCNWNVKALEVTEEQYYKIKIVLEYGAGESKTVTRTVHVPALAKKTLPKALGYTLFSESNETALSMYGWQSYITGNVYSGKDYVYQGSILEVAGAVDTVGTITTNGWQLNIEKANEAQEAVAMPDLDADIMKKANVSEAYSESKTFTEDTTVLEGTICSEQDITFSGTTFSGTGYVIADNNITCNINQGSTYNDGKVVMYAKEGDITLNGSEIALNGILYAPNGTVRVNANIFRLYGRIIAKEIVMNTSQNYIEGDENDITYIYDGEYETDHPESRGFYENTFLEEEIAGNLSENGIFTVICDAGVEGTAWNHVTWNGIRVDDSDVEVRIATSEDGETYSEEVLVTNSKVLENVCGRYARVSVCLLPSCDGVTPRVTDVTVSTENADLVTNAAPVWNLEQTVYETEVGESVTVMLKSQDDAIGNRNTHILSFNLPEDVSADVVQVEDVSATEKKVTISQSGTYNFTATVSDGEFTSEQVISVCVTDPSQEGEGSEPEEPQPEEPQPEEPQPEEPQPEEPEYILTSQIERIEFNEDYSKLQIFGTVSAEGHMKKYQLCYGLLDQELVTISQGEAEVEAGLLGEIATEDLANGNYVIYLLVEDESGAMCEATAEFEITAGQIPPGAGEDNPQPEEPEDTKLTEEQRNQLVAAKQSAIEWLKTQADAEGNWSKDGLMNTTCDALAVLKLNGNEMESVAYANWAVVLEPGNIDEQCHAIWGKPDTEALKALWEQQNADGGFGLTTEYTSDLYDTLLVLKTEGYMQKLGYAATEPEKIQKALYYIATRRNADGGFGYHETDGSRITLSAEYALLLNQFGLQLQDESLAEFCKEQYTGSFEEESYYNQAMLTRVQVQYNDASFVCENLDKILAVQKENGSIYDKVEDTIVFITLLDEMITGEE